jgi:hypothetical protein
VLVSCAPGSGHAARVRVTQSRHYLQDGYTCFRWFAARARCRIAPTVFSLSPTWREIDAILVTELSRWGRSSIDLVQTLQSLQAWDVPVLANSGLQFDLSTPHGKMIASVMAALAEFERDLIRERIKSGIAAAKARGKRLGRRPGQRPSDRKATQVLKLVEAGLSYRLVGSPSSSSWRAFMPKGLIPTVNRMTAETSRCDRPAARYKHDQHDHQPERRADKKSRGGRLKTKVGSFAAFWL